MDQEIDDKLNVDKLAADIASRLTSVPADEVEAAVKAALNGATIKA